MLAYLLSLGTGQKLHLEMHQPIKKNKMVSQIKINFGFTRSDKSYVISTLQT